MGVGYQILTNSCFDAGEVAFALKILTLRRRYFGNGVSVEWARHMHGWGRVLSFEAQEVVYYTLAINNCLNARAKLAALGEAVGEIVIPQPDY